jgi:hypothetical protein
MVLRQCRECGGRVSSKAVTCPSCGAPLKRKSATIGGCSGCLLILVAVIICAGLFNLGIPPAVGLKPHAGREPATTGAKTPPVNAPRPNADAETTPAGRYEVVRKSLDAEAQSLIDQYPIHRDIDEKAVDTQFDFVKKSATEAKFKTRSRQLQKMVCSRFAHSRPAKTEADVEELRKKMKDLNDRLVEAFADLIRNGQIAVDTKEPTVAADNRDQVNAASKTDDEIDVDGLVLVRKSTQGTRGEFSGEITGTVINRRDYQLSYAQISFNLYDASGAQVGSAIANINHLEPGGRWNFKASTFGTDFVKYKFSELSGF